MSQLDHQETTRYKEWTTAKCPICGEYYQYLNIKLNTCGKRECYEKYFKLQEIKK